MYIERIELNDFRNYESLCLEPDPSTNIIYGDNAQGKTNILEGIFMGATTRSHRQSRDKDIIRFGCSEAHIRIILKKKDIDYRIDMHLRKNNSKVIAVNGVAIKKAAQLLGILNIVFFSPEDLSIIKEGPAERRRFIDMELCQLDGIYLNDLSVYNRTINQRNRLLREMGDIKDIDMMLDVYDEQLLKSGRDIIRRRRSFINEIEETVRDIHYSISGKKENITLEYDCDIDEEKYGSALKDARDKDRRYRTTTVGPHKDDIIFNINRKDVRRFGSQGQQRTAALSLKLAEISLIRKIINDDPVLLLDDVLSELDENRQTFLLDSIKGIQTVITCTGLDEFINRSFNINRLFRISDAQLIPG